MRRKAPKFLRYGIQNRKRRKNFVCRQRGALALCILGSGTRASTAYDTPSGRVVGVVTNWRSQDGTSEASVVVVVITSVARKIHTKCGRA